jgi:Flp pilus assembly protein TadB
MPSRHPMGRRRTIGSMKRPPVTIRCECGETRQVPYGERWACSRCGRTWNTAQIPAAEYEGILREMRAFRLTAIGAALLISVVFAVVAFMVATSFVLLIPVVLSGWYLFYMPLWRKKVRRRARNLPTWQLHPE